MNQSTKFPVFDFGDMGPADIQRVQEEFRTLPPAAHDQTERDTATSIGQQFVMFVREALTRLGLLGPVGEYMQRLGVEVSVPEGAAPGEVMQKLWDNRAHDWAVVESPANYLMTMRTLLEFFKLNNKVRKERIVSLGCGPGLYEIFLAHLFHRTFGKAKEVRIVCTDFSPEMTNQQRRVLDLSAELFGQRVMNVRTVTENMMRLSFPSGTVDQIICVNSLQWVPDWQQVLEEMRRVLNPKSLGWVYLLVHLHPMSVFLPSGETLFKFGDFTIPELLDALEARHFQIHSTRQIQGRAGTGQAGLPTQRYFVLARYCHRGVGLKKWREANISGALSTMSL